jgi:Skp family chaperone for outer membrane proteins
MKIFVIALSLFLLPATTVVAQTSTTDSIKSYSVEKKNEAVAASKKLVNDFDVKIKDLEKQVSKDMSAAGADAKRQMKELTDLKAARAETSKKLDEMSKASAESWNGAQKAFHDSYKDLQKAYDTAIAKVRK